MGTGPESPVETTAPFVHLRLHSEFSLVDSVLRISGGEGGFCRAVRERGMPAVALTDLNNMFGAVRFYRAALDAGVKPILGADVDFGRPEDGFRPGRVTFLCRNARGYRNLLALLTRMYLELEPRGAPALMGEWLSVEALDGLIGLIGLDSAGGRGPEARRERERILALRRLMGDGLFLEVSRLGRPGETELTQRTVELANAEGIPLVAVNDVRFLDSGEFTAHEARVCIHRGETLNDPRRERRYTPQQYLRSPAEMAELFADLPEALSNTAAIARACTVELDLGESRLPKARAPAGLSEWEFLEREALTGLKRQLGVGAGADAELPGRYTDRLRAELEVVRRMDFPGYFLIVADIVRWARDNQVPVGPGRGSAAGSLISYALGITAIDPLRYGLIFERFLNPERISMPDIDIDFCAEQRERVLEHVAEEYGRDRVAQIITFNRLAARAAIKDATRVLGHPLGLGEQIAGLIPALPVGVTIEQAMKDDRELSHLYNTDTEARAVIDLALQLEGLPRNSSTHAGGVVIAPSELIQFTPLYRQESDAPTVTQFDKDDIESVGLVKFDFLALNDLTTITRTVEEVNRARRSSDEPPIDMARLPLDDSRVYELLRNLRTRAVFQLESRGMRDLIRDLRPDRFSDMIALVALFRPGPLQTGMADTYIKRKHGQESVDYLHDDLRELLGETYGVILYQEQVMEIARLIAGYSFAQADVLRRAMGKKLKDEMADQRSVFVKGALKHGLTRGKAEHIFNLMETFAGYGFNKSHSTAYAIVAYQTAWLKAHYPAQYMASTMTTDMSAHDRLYWMTQECLALGLAVERPDVNRSLVGFSAVDDKAVRCGLGAIRGLGQAAAQAIRAEREANGPYTGVADLFSRISGAGLHQRQAETLVRSGALDSLCANRAALIRVLPAALAAAAQAARDAESGQEGLFDDGGDQPMPIEIPDVPDWGLRELLDGERRSLGFCLSGHPFDECRDEARVLTGGALREILDRSQPGPRDERDAPDVTVAGSVLRKWRRSGANYFDLDDGATRLPVRLPRWDAGAPPGRLITPHSLVLVKGRLSRLQRGSLMLFADSVEPLDDVMEDRARLLLLDCRAAETPAETFTQLKDLLRPHVPGATQVVVRYSGPAAAGSLRLGSHWNVRATGGLRHALGDSPVISEFRIRYA
ncbi:MAG: DNA polymerase III subunit alpha [Gammaproteobacteria bacterium]|nr:DNA polymerase III subunit alpha [Gammaproteobacteria bacterium]MYD01451.1 DNA polymerase III subunit alpha [Gammaproteobacteria bacterium]MYI23881.1 DNA polymerase III subunit alpha [Gammaproteobacteria bacterium]